MKISSPVEIAGELKLLTEANTRAQSNRSRAVKTRGAVLTLAFSWMVFGVAATRAETQGGGRAGARTPLSAFVPAATPLFISMRSPRDVATALERVHAWRLLPLLGGSGGLTRSDFTLKKWIREFLGSHRTIQYDELLDARLGIMAPNWTKIGRSTWLVRPQDDDVLLRWFPRLKTNRASGFFGTEAGLVVCARSGVALLNRSGGGGAIFGDAIRLMAGQSEPSLNQDRVYQELHSFLPGSPLAVVYMNGQGTDGGTPPGWPVSVDRAVLGLYEGHGRIDLALRGVRTRSQPAEVLKQELLARVLRLPRTTLLVSIFSRNWASEASSAGGRPGSSLLTWGRVLTLLRGLHSSSRATDPLESLDSQIIVAWDQDFRVGASAPQIAVLVRCSNGGVVKQALEQVFGNMLALLAAMDSGSSTAPAEIESSRHLGIELRGVSLRSHAAHAASELGRLLENVEPSWAIMDDWLMVAASRDHIERIIDAYRGLTPTLSALPDMAQIAKRRVKRTSLTIAQADLAAAVVQSWLADLKAGKRSILDPRIFNGSSGPAGTRPTRLGIGMSPGQAPGEVTVARVYPATVADGVLQVDDRILGIDGHLLNVEAANQDLRARWLRPESDAAYRVFRIRRGDQVLDVNILARRRMKVGGRPAVAPADLLSEFVSLGKSLQFVSLATFQSAADRYSARLSLRLKPSQ